MDKIKWQPIILIIDGRLECKCGALGIFVSGKLNTEHYNCLEQVDVWCQECYEKEQKEGELYG